MSKPNKSRLRMETLRQNAYKDVEQTLEFEGVDGEAYSIPMPQFWPDLVYIHAAAENLPEMGKALLGSQYDAYVNGGGRSADLLLVIQAYGEDQGVSLGESISS